ncbi:hypothetical protein OG874_37660 [Nocardia sp. NBC_00565]|uniref:hypothetical protein n=1 Tax=Nocardia sp. NBC_00565 TaxID=2975993 RepID=UPI002E813CA4|nr:hypothetical protein [Nocardia sp. NBC_00565]WUC02394.1 hypothetical protein OG874_37660 [Nocardia sp. NBC_00565]
MSYTVRYSRPPSMSISYDCGGMSCGIGTIEHDGDSFVCSDCGTSWTDEGDDGELHEQWSGETPVGDPVHPDAWFPRKRSLK